MATQVTLNSGSVDSAGSLALKTGGTTTAVTIDTSQNVGIGRSPNYQLDVYRSGTTNATIASANDNVVNILQVSGNTAGVIGTITSHPLVFTAGNTERARIDSSGNLLVGTTSTLARFSLRSSGNDTTTWTAQFEASDGTDQFGVRSDGATYMGLDGASPYNLTTASAANAALLSDGFLYRSTSSLKYKQNVTDATHGLAEVMQLRPVTYKGKSEADGDKVFGGLIAEEVHEAGLTEFVQYAEDGSPDALAYGNMVSLCINAIKEQQALITQLQADVEALKGTA